VTGPGNDVVVELSHVTCAYGAVPVVDHVDLTVCRGEFVGIVGPSGAGKTTLLKALLGSVRPVHGHSSRPSTGTSRSRWPRWWR
jgi:ABC-type multidrug transport system ATPase subunit